MTYEVRWTETSLRQLEKLEKNISKRILEKLEKIKKDPFLYVNKLKGIDLFKLRIGDYRVIMSIDRGKMIIFVVEVGHRSIIYRRY